MSLTGGFLDSSASWKWYSGSCGGTILGTGNFIYDNPSITTTYYVRAEGICNTTSCISAIVIINTSITVTTAISTPNLICIGDTSVLSFTGGSLASGAIWKWFSGSCGGTFIGTGNSIYESPSNSITYYVRAEGICNTTNCISTMY